MVASTPNAAQLRRSAYGRRLGALTFGKFTLIGKDHRTEVSALFTANFSRRCAVRACDPRVHKFSWSPARGTRSDPRRAAVQQLALPRAVLTPRDSATVMCQKIADRASGRPSRLLDHPAANQRGVIILTRHHRIPPPRGFLQKSPRLGFLTFLYASPISGAVRRHACAHVTQAATRPLPLSAIRSLFLGPP